MPFNSQPAFPQPLRSGYFAFALAVLLLLAGLALSGANQAVFLALNHWGAPLGGRFWSGLTILGDSLVALSVLLPLVQRRPELVWSAILAALVATLYSRGLKSLLDVVRPAGELAPDSFNIIGPTLTRYALPSGHSVTALLLAGIFWLYLRPAWLKVLVLATAVAAALSRIMVGAHWPLDVAAGMLGGWLSAYAGVWLSRHWRWGVGEAGQRLLAAGLLLCALWLLFFHDTEYPDADWLQRFIAGACLLLSLAGLKRLFGR
jgi:membrane-associated phospholipid phosphatase